MVQGTRQRENYDWNKRGFEIIYEDILVFWADCNSKRHLR